MKKLLLLLTLFFYNFTIAQSIVSVNPNNANRAQQNLDVGITADDVDFEATSPTLRVSLIDQFSNVLPASNVYTAAWDVGYLTANFNIPGYAIPGLYDVHVYDTNGTIDLIMDDGFTINEAYSYAIQGNVRFDFNNNGCDASDPPMPNLRINFSGPSTGSLITNTTGSYDYYNLIAGSYSFNAVLENPSYFSISPPNVNVTLSASNHLVAQDFCIVPVGNHNDLEVSLYNISSARPGFDAMYVITYKNKGNQVQNGVVSLNFSDAKMDLVNSNPATDSQGTDTLNWNFTNLMPFESRTVYFTMNVNSPAESPAVNAGDILIFTATATGATDETPDNNTSVLNQTVIGSIDPNDKTCVEGPTLPIGDVGKYLHYVIRFENSGTANAEFVVINDVIDTSKFDMSTLMPLSGSHPFTTRISNTNRVEFVFDNINLPFDDANNDGFVSFKIKTKPTLTVGTNISNTANIYFDYNLPVTTNTYTTTVINPLAVEQFEFNNLFTLSPLPAKDVLVITNKQSVSLNAVTIYNTLGQLVQYVANPTENLDVSALRTGVYIIKITSDGETLSSRFIKK